MHSNGFGNAVFYAIPYVAFTLVIHLPLRTPKPKASKPVASKSVPPTKRPSPVPLPSQSLKRVKEETDWFSSDQYRMHEQQWYGSAEADEWVEVPEEELSASVPVKTEEAASSSKGKSNAPASGSKGKGKQSGQRSGWFNKMAILLARMQRGEWKEVKLLTTAQLAGQ